MGAEVKERLQFFPAPSFMVSADEEQGAEGDFFRPWGDDSLIACDPIGSWRSHYILYVPIHRPPRPRTVRRWPAVVYGTGQSEAGEPQ